MRDYTVHPGSIKGSLTLTIQSLPERCRPQALGFCRAYIMNWSRSALVAHTASYTMGTGSLSRGVKRPVRGVDHPTSSSARVKERVELYLYPPLGLHGPF